MNLNDPMNKESNIADCAGHTPGPWRWYDELVLAGGDGRIGLCVIARSSGGFPFDTNPENEANAHLISAAPDLLAACEKLVTEYDEAKAELAVHGFVMNSHHSTEICRAAIVKSKGQNGTA